MVLSDYYNNLSRKSPRNLFKERIIKECGICQATFQFWVKGKVKIPLNARQKIAEMTNLPLEELFPISKKQSNEKN